MTSPVRERESAGHDIVLASWNVHGWIGRDARRDPERCFEVIRRLDADVVALQEVEGVDWEDLASACGYRLLVQHPGATPFGNALLSRRAVAAVAEIDLSVAGRERRGAIDAVLETPRGALRVVTTHFGLRGFERRRQAAQLAQHLGSQHSGTPTTVLGDLNDWTPWARHLAPLTRRIGPFSRVATFPSRRPVLALDRAAVHAVDRRARVVSVADPTARLASDHLPLRVALSLDGEGSAMR